MRHHGVGEVEGDEVEIGNLLAVETHHHWLLLVQLRKHDEVVVLSLLHLIRVLHLHYACTACLVAQSHQRPPRHFLQTHDAPHHTYLSCSHCRLSLAEQLFELFECHWQRDIGDGLIFGLAVKAGVLVFERVELHANKCMIQS